MDPGTDGDGLGPTRRRSFGSVRTVSAKSVAASAGVSVGTVSNVLNRPELVSETTRNRVQQVMQDLGYVPNGSARQLRVGHSSTLAYVMLDVTNPFFTDVAQGAEESADGADYSLVLCNSGNSVEREQSHLRRLEQQRVDGILITPFDPDNPVLDKVASRGTPVVIVDRTRLRGTHCSVAVDDVLGGRLAVQHLVELGHERIAFVGGPSSLGQVRDRLDGARAAMVDAGITVDNLVLVETRALTVAEGRSAGERLAGLPRKRRPTAALCGNDLVALGLLQQCVALGLDVPGDLAIVGYDDIEFAAAAAVPLTSVRQPRRELGIAATELLLDEVRNPDHEHERRLFTPELVVRASTRRPRG